MWSFHTFTYFISNRGFLLEKNMHQFLLTDAQLWATSGKWQWAKKMQVHKHTEERKINLHTGERRNCGLSVREEGGLINRGETVTLFVASSFWLWMFSMWVNKVAMLSTNFEKSFVGFFTAPNLPGSFNSVSLSGQFHKPAICPLPLSRAVPQRRRLFWKLLWCKRLI